ncbi:dCMP deaminase [Agrobacterium phage Atu_ph04]|uniref:dCMP deaminase n=1 Tax=Agrobacterium phage Atu_ph04 TaxID=2024263 RepID=A0A223W0J6_9CAUD|nr:dCMP deaminase [Agrobacterium phage Atu_ph04]ASV44677.1 dCMP deaminase [Agrobacterium phage Atu_ph04]
MKFEFLQLAFKTAVEAADMSKYDGSHVGAVLVKDSRIVATGWNGYPSGVNDKYVNTLPRDKRLMMTIHAENNAILNAAKAGVQIEGCDAIVTHKPCVQCLSKMRNAGVATVRYIVNEGFEAAWCDQHEDLYNMIEGIELHRFKKENVLPTEHHRNLYSTLDSYQVAKPVVLIEDIVYAGPPVEPKFMTDFIAKRFGEVE